MPEYRPLTHLIERLSHSPATCISPGCDATRFVARVHAWRKAFAAQPGLRWALYADDAVEFAATLFGAWHAGKAVVLPCDRQPGTLHALRADIDGFAGDFPEALSAGVPAGATGLDNTSDIVVIPSVDTASIGQMDAVPWAPLCAQATTVTLFTSGSTGAPTALTKRLRQLDTEVSALETAFGAMLGEGGSVIATVSHQHIYGLLFCVLWPLSRGTDLPSARLAFHEEIAAAGGTSTVLVSSPAHLRRMPATLDWTASRATLRAVFSSGGALPREAADSVRDCLGKHPVEVYGSSETGGIAWRSGSVDASWTPLPGVEWRIDEDLLAVRSGHLAASGWHVGNDRVEPAGDGGFRLLGRADRIVKIEEKRVSLSALERHLNASDLVQDARALTMQLDIGERIAVVAAPSEQGAALLARDGRAGLARALRAYLHVHMEAIALPRRWAFPSTMPVNAQGKTSETLLRQCLQGILPIARWLVSEDRDSAVAILDIDMGLQVFDGHFQDTPIVPGVAQVDWAISLAEQALDVPSRERFMRLDLLKFQQVIRPGAAVRMELNWLADSRTLSFRLSSAGGVHASGRVVYEENNV